MFLTVKNKSLDITHLKSVIFDMDGTLIESEHVWAEAKKHIAEIYGSQRLAAGRRDQSSQTGCRAACQGALHHRSQTGQSTGAPAQRRCRSSRLRWFRD